MSDKKLYYSINEVADELSKAFSEPVAASVLRHWEKELGGFLRPRRTHSGRRDYTKEDIDLLKTIFYLTKKQGLSLAGAKKKILEKRRRAPSSKPENIYEHLTATLTDIRTRLVELRKSIVLPKETD